MPSGSVKTRLLGYVMSSCPSTLKGPSCTRRQFNQPISDSTTSVSISAQGNLRSFSLPVADRVVIFIAECVASYELICSAVAIKHWIKTFPIQLVQLDVLLPPRSQLLADQAPVGVAELLSALAD